MNSKGQSLIEFLLVTSTGMFLALIIVGLLISKVWILNISELLLQEFIFCNQNSEKIFCTDHYTRKIERYIPGSKVSQLKFHSRGSVKQATAEIRFLNNRNLSLSKTLSLD
jgi:hypothetical protein